MNNYSQVKGKIIFLLAIINFMYGCSPLTTRTPEPDYYLLTSLSKTDNQDGSLEASKIDKKKTIIIGPVEIPAYLDRQEIVRRKGSNKVHVLKLNRWAEPLPNGMERVLAQNIFTISGGKILCYPFSMIVPEEEKNFDLRVMLNVYQFEGTDDGKCRLDTEYFLTLPNNKDIFHKRIILTATMQGDSIPDVIRCQNRLLDRLSYTVAQKLVEFLSK